VRGCSGVETSKEGDMILEKGNMWDVYEESDLWLFTGNSYINQRGELVMGRGLALEVKTRYKYVPECFGRRIVHLDTYGVEALGDGWDNFGVFQVKHHFKANAELMLIGYSCVKLVELIELQGLGRVDLNFPGIGYGKLDRAEVLPIIAELPDAVHVWEKG